MTLVLVGGLSRAGKSTLADALCAATPAAQHVPLDKYFHEVPAGRTFIDWVQTPAALDWELLTAHLERLAAGEDIYTPALDWRDSGRRLANGGDEAHPRARRVAGGAACYVMPGCHAFAAPFGGEHVIRWFVDPPLHVIASRCAGRDVTPDEVAPVLAAHSPAYRELLTYRDRADRVIAGQVSDPAVIASLCTELGLRP